MAVCRCLNLIWLLFATTVCTSVASFDEVPSSLVVPLGTEATFRCRHQAADIVGWLVNGTSVGRIISSDITPGTIRYDGGSLVYTLTILASTEFDNSEVECVASFVHQPLPPERSPVVTLSVLEGTNETSHDGFVRVPSSFNGTDGSEIVFTCKHTWTSAIKWLINGAFPFDGDYPPNITASHNVSGGIAIHSLTVHPPITNYNGTVIQCAAFIEIQPIRTLPAVLLVQGPLGSISSLTRNASTLSWIPPFSLNLTGVDPDIVYCVQVYNITCGRRDLIVSECDVMETSYTNDALQPGYIYECTVTPRSNVDGASNGSINMVTEQYIRLMESARGWTVSTVNRSYANVTLSLDLSQQNQGAIKPESYSTLLTSIDGVQDYDGLTLPVIAIPSENESSVDIVLEVPFRRVLDVKVLAHDCQEHPLTKTIELGTHDVYDITVSSPLPGVVMVTGDVVIGSTSTGILAIIYSSHSDFNVSYRSVPHNSTQPGVYSVGVELPSDQYEVAVFVVEESGEPFLRAASRPKPVLINRTGDHPSPAIEYTLDNNPDGVCITCIFLDATSTDCVAVVHQRISQLSSSGLMNIESNYKFTRSGVTAYGCIEVNLEDHEVGVIGGQLIVTLKDNSSVCTECIIISILALLFTAIVVSFVISIPIVLTLKKRRIFSFAESSNTNSSKQDQEEASGASAVENDYTQKYDITEVTKTYSQEGEEPHTHITELELTSLARSASDVYEAKSDMANVDMPNVDMAIVDMPITSEMHSIKTSELATIKPRESISVLRSITEEQPYAVSHDTWMFSERKQSLHNMQSDDWGRTVDSIGVPVTKCTEVSEEAGTQKDYPVESVFQETSSPTLLSLIHIPSVSKLMRFQDECRAEEFLSESPDQSPKFEAPQGEVSRLVVGGSQDFPIQVTDQNSPAASALVVGPSMFFHPHRTLLSQEDLRVEQTSHTNELSGFTEAEQEGGQPLKSPRSVFTGQSGAAAGNITQTHDILQKNLLITPPQSPIFAESYRLNNIQLAQ